MKKLFIIANWKSNKTESEAKNWLQNFKVQDLGLTNKEIIVCPPFTLFSGFKSSIINLNSSLKLGAQDISPFDEGAYTGEVTGRQIKEFADYVIIGHSERRSHFGETDEIIVKKIEQAVKNNLTPLICISNKEQISIIAKTINILNSQFSTFNFLVAYEPTFAIGSGIADTPQNANDIGLEIKKFLKEAYVLYGGSVTPQNVNSFTNMPLIDGVLVGKVSLNPQEFSAVIANA